MVIFKDFRFEWFSLRLSTWSLMSTWLLSALMFSIIISSEITMYFSLDFETKQINTIRELVASDMTLVVWPSFRGLNWISDQSLLNTIIDRFTKTKTNLPVKDMIVNKQWIVSASYGRTAFFLFEVPLKMIAIIHRNSLKTNTKFRFLDERFGPPFLATVATSKKLPKSFRDQVNLK